jgi:hypothetical protein
MSQGINCRRNKRNSEIKINLFLLSQNIIALSINKTKLTHFFIVYILYVIKSVVNVTK